MTDPAAAPAEEAQDPSGTGDLISGVVAVGFGIATLLYIRGFPQLPDGAPGPALFPGILGGLFVLFGSILVVRWYRHRTASSAAAAAGETAPSESPQAGVAPAESTHDPLAGPSIPASTAWLNALSVLGTVVLYILLADVLGFALTMSLLLFGLAWRLGARPLVAAISACLTAGLLYLLFERILSVPLPLGLFG